MSDITTNYIYLLQEREFIKTKEPIYKVGMTKKENHERFNQYPKGSVLLFQMICNDCKNIEKHLINIFKEKFIQRKDIGNEYFEGEYKNMIDIIYSTIHNEKEERENFKQPIEEDSYDNTEEQPNEEPIYQITTYEEWIKHNGISGIIITNKTGVGYLRCDGQLWRELYDKNRFDFDEDNMEHLLPWIEQHKSPVVKIVSPSNDLVSWNELMHLMYLYKHKETNEIISWNNHHKLNEIEQNNYIYLSKKDKYKFIEVEYNVNKIYQDIINKCYVKSCDFYNLNYHEYAFHNINKNYSDYVIINCSNFTFTGVDDLINNKILTGKVSGCIRSIYIKNIVNISIVNDILNSLISNEIKIQYKKLAYNLIVKQEEKQIIFYDYNECLLTTWIMGVLHSISGYNFYVKSYEYYENKSEFKKKLKTKKYRCVIIGNHNVPPILIETQINDFIKLGFKNIIVCKNDKKNTMYNIENFRKYLHDNKEILLKCIKEENNYVPINSWDCELQHDDNIFYKSDLLLTNFFKWCCVL